MNKIANNKLRLLWIVLTIITAVTIFVLSNQSKEESKQLSQNVASSLNIEAQNEWVGSDIVTLAFGMTLRKWAHVILFAMLGFFSAGAFRRWIYAFAFCLAYAILDEVHQIFVPGRTASITDVLIDILGFLPFILLFVLLEYLIKKRKKHGEIEP